MMVFGKARLVFLSVPKTGTTAYEEALAGAASMVVSDPPELKHAPLYRYNRFFRPALEKFVSPDIETLAVVREPLDWLGSWYRYRRRPFMAGQPNATHDISFDDFVAAYLKGKRPAYAEVGSQFKFLEPQPNGTRVTHLFRYDDQAGLRDFLEARLGVPVQTARRNVSPEMALTLAPAIEDRLRRKAAEEFALYDSIPVRGAAAAG